MDRYDFTQPGGLPFDQGTMKFLQNCINIAAQSACLAGPLAILSGCVIAGGSAGDGWVVINGEVLPFQGGIISDKVVIRETGEALIFQDTAPRVVKFTRYATFGDDGITTILWADFVRNTNTGVLADIAALDDDIATIGADITAIETDVADLQDTTIKKLASGTAVIGDADTNHSSVGPGTTVTIPIGKTLADTNYQVLFTVLSLSANGNDDLYHSISIRRKGTTSFDVYFRIVAVTTQDINLDWTLIKLL